jgi:hypothetical protein
MLKNKFIRLGIAFFTVGMIMLAFSFTQTRINVNAMTATDWSQASIKSIGVKTKALVLKAEPVANVSDLATINGIGTVKIAALKKHFCVYDTCRFEIFITILIIGIIFIGLGVMLIFTVLMRRKILYDQIHKDVSILKDR